jgi:hypothetical protein
MVLVNASEDFGIASADAEGSKKMANPFVSATARKSSLFPPPKTSTKIEVRKGPYKWIRSTSRSQEEASREDRKSAGERIHLYGPILFQILDGCFLGRKMADPKGLD